MYVPVLLEKKNGSVLYVRICIHVLYVIGSSISTGRSVSTTALQRYVIYLIRDMIPST